MTDTKDVLLKTDADAIKLAKTLIRTARSGALATLDPEEAAPIATRVGVSSDIDGVPVILVSHLAAHTPALLANPRCSLLLGTPGKGDPLAHARITLACDARPVERDSAAWQRIEVRYLAHQQKARFYAALPDFIYFRLEPRSASLNGGFGRAYALKSAEVMSQHPCNDELAAAEMQAIAHMNDDHTEAIALYARHYASAPAGNWVLVGIDAEGIDIASGDDVRRIFFNRPLTSRDEMRRMLVEMATEARKALGASSAAIH